MTTYRIKNWSTIYENDRSRQRDQCRWCAIPNKQDGLGYSRLVSMKNGPAMYGCFIALAMIISKQGKHRDGYLTTKGHATDPALTADDISIIIRMPVELVEQTLSATSSAVVDWVEKIQNTEQNEESGTDSHPSNSAVTADSPHSHPEGKGKEGNRREGKSSSPAGDGGVVLTDFDKFWSAYPRKVGKGSAKVKFEKAIKKTTLEVMLAAIASQKRSDQWTKDGGQFIPHPDTWLNQERWSDGGPEVPTLEASPSEDVKVFRILNNTYTANGPGPKRFEFKNQEEFDTATDLFERWKAKQK